MANFIRNTQVKAMTSIWAAKQKARELAGRTKEALANREGQGTLDVAITVLISIVLGRPDPSGPLSHCGQHLAADHYPAHQGYVRLRRLMFSGNRRGAMPRRTFYQGGFLWLSLIHI